MENKYEKVFFDADHSIGIALSLDSRGFVCYNLINSEGEISSFGGGDCYVVQNLLKEAIQYYTESLFRT